MSKSSWASHPRRRRRRFTVPPLRVAGQSLDEAINVLHDRISELFLAPFLFVAVAAYGWIQWWTGRLVHPIILTGIALLITLHAGGQIWHIRARIKHLRFGLDGERLVGQLLERLRAKGYRVFHDLLGPSFNIDHVIVGPAGIFIIETKARSKPDHGGGKIFYNGQTVRIDGHKAGADPLRQARTHARWLAEFLNRESTGAYSVRSVVVYPEWYIERTGTRNQDDVWVLNPKALAKFLDYEPHVLSSLETDSVARLLTEYNRHPLRESA